MSNFRVKRKSINRSCFVPGCRTGYKSNKVKKTLFSTPKHAELFEKWARAIPREDRKLDKFAAVCEVHFDERFIERNYTYIINGKEVYLPRTKPILKDGAFPTEFLCLPSYLHKQLPPSLPSQNKGSPPPNNYQDNTLEHLFGTTNVPNLKSEIEELPADNSCEKECKIFSKPSSPPSKIGSPKTQTLSMKRKMTPSSPMLIPTQNDEPPPIMKIARVETVESIKSEPESNEPNILEEVSQLRENQNVMLHQLKDMSLALFGVENKLDSIVAALRAKDTATDPPLNEIWRSLPASSEGVIELENKIQSCRTTRSQLKQFLTCLEKEDCRSFVTDCLRKIMTYDAALQYSLTGRAAGEEKLSFERTEMFMVIKEVILEIFGDVKEKDVRDAVSTWFVQAKFRIAQTRKLKRRKES